MTAKSLRSKADNEFYMNRANWQHLDTTIKISLIKNDESGNTCLHFFNCYSITVVSMFPPLPSSTHLIPHFHSQFPHCCPCPQAIHTCSLSIPFPLFPPLTPSPLPSGHFQSVPCFHACGSILFSSLFCSLDSSYRWDHMVFLCHWLAYFT